LDVCKDRLYVEAIDAHTRRCAQTVAAAVAATLIKVVAPVLPHTAEEAWAFTPQPLRKQWRLDADVAAAAARNGIPLPAGAPPLDSVFTLGWPTPPAAWVAPPPLQRRWEAAMALRDCVNGKRCECLYVRKCVCVCVCVSVCVCVCVRVSIND
jgi:isoleucyl-tRNA synthetase